MIADLSRWVATGVFILAPIPFGSIDTPWIMAWAGLLAVSIATARIPSHNVGDRFLVGGSTLLLALLAVVTVLDWWPGLAAPYPEWQRAAALLPGGEAARGAASAGEPWRFYGNALCMTLAFVRAFWIGKNEANARRLLSLLAWTASGLAVVSTIAFFLDPRYVLGRPKMSYADDFVGTFMHRNPAAIYFATGAILWFGMICDRFRREAAAHEGLSRFIRAAARDGVPRDLLMLLGGFLIAAVAVFETRSRAGGLLMLVGCGLVALLVRPRPASRTTQLSGLGALGLAAGVAAALVLLLEVVGSGVGGRVAQSGGSDLGRLETYRATLLLIADVPWLGVGLGNFELVFPSYRTAELLTSGIWNRVHSTPLEQAAESGIPYALAVAAFWFAAGAMLLRGVLRRRRGRVLPASAFSVAIVATLHSLIDFPLQIPGYAIVFAAILGVGLAQRTRSETAVNRSSDGLPQ